MIHRSYYNDDRQCRINRLVKDDLIIVMTIVSVFGKRIGVSANLDNVDSMVDAEEDQFTIYPPRFVASKLIANERVCEHHTYMCHSHVLFADCILGAGAAAPVTRNARSSTVGGI